MKFYLAKEQVLTSGFVASNQVSASRTCANAAYHFAITKKPEVILAHDSIQNRIQLETLQTLIYEKSFGKKLPKDLGKRKEIIDGLRPWKISVIVGKLDYDGNYVGVKTNDPSLAEFLDHSNGNESGLLEAKFEDGIIITANHMRLSPRNKSLMYARGTNVSIPDAFWKMMEKTNKNGTGYEGSSAQCTINAEISDEISLFTSAMREPININRIVLETSSDLLIIGCDGVKVKALKHFLKAKSKVFAAMLDGESKFMESKTGEYSTVKFNGACMQAVVNYCVYGDLESCRGDVVLAFDCIRAAQYYHMDGLLADVTELMMDRKLYISNDELSEMLKYSTDCAELKTFATGITTRMRRQMTETDFSKAFQTITGHNPEPAPEIHPKI